MRVSAGPSCAAITPHRNALHGQRAGVSVPEDMERRGGFNLGAGARGVQRALLVRQPPCLAIVAEENELALGAPAVNSAKSACPSSARTTWRGLPDLLSRTVMVPASALKSAARMRVNSP